MSSRASLTFSLRIVLHSERPLSFLKTVFLSAPRKTRRPAPRPRAAPGPGGFAQLEAESAGQDRAGDSGDSAENRPQAGRRGGALLPAAGPEVTGEGESRHSPVGHRQCHGSPTSDQANP